ncbi:MAG TPA: hypothetical protein VFB62_26810, partial [Polyangiaceae bacterium]|nr:hypothetical protein [Polyangiaceae bacterium]
MAGRERSKRRRVLRWVALVLATPVVLVLLVLVFLHTGPGQRWVTRKIVERAGERLNGTLEIEAVTFAFFGDVHVRGLRIRDESGTEVVKLASLEVEPDWGELVRGTPAFDRVALSGLSLHIERYADGSSNLKKLIKPKPPEPEAPPTKPRETRVIIRSLEVDDVALTVDRPDGLRIGLERFGLKGSIDAVPSKQTVKLDIPEVRANLRVEQPKDGLAIRLDDIVVGLAVDLSEGAGKITLPPTRARVRIEQKGAPPRKADIELKAAELSLGPGELDIALDKLLVGALVLEALELHGAVAEGNLKGQQKVQVVGLKVDHEKLNTLLGKKVLASDVAIETKITGPPERILLDTKVSAGHATLALDGVVDARDPSMPRYRLKLAGAQFESGELVASKKVPPIKLDVLELGVSGTGITREDVEADIGLRLGPLGVDRHRIDEVSLQARLDGAILQIDPLRVKGVGSTLWLRGTVDLVNKLVDATLTIEGDVGTALERLRQAGLNISTRLPAGALTLREGVVTVAIKGELEGLLEADVKIKNAPMAGGAIAADLHATLRRNVDPAPGEKKVALEGVHGTVELKEIGIQELAALRGKKLAMTGKVSGKMLIDDDGGEPSVRYDLSARAQSTVSDKLEPDKPMLQVHASGKANKHDVSLDLDVTGVHKDKKLEIAKGTVRVPIYVDGKARGLSPQRPLRVKLTVQERTVEELQPYLPIPLPFDGTVSANLDLEGTAAAPQGKLDVDVKLDALEGQSQKVTIDGVVKSENGKVAVDADVNAWLDTKKDPTLSGKGHVELSRSPLVQGPREATWNLKVDAKPPPLEELAMFSSKLDGVSGNATAHIDVHGNERDVYGKIDVDLRRVKRNNLGPIDADVGLDIGNDDTKVALDAQLAGIKMVRTRGKVARSGKGLLAAVRDKTPGKSLGDKLGNPALDVTVDLLEHALSVHERQVPRLKDAPGNVGGRIHVGGDMKTPTADGVIGLRGFRTVSGEKGNALLRIDAGREHLGARIEIGPTPAPVVISAGTEREALKKYLAAKKCEKNCPEEDARLPIELHASAERVDIRRIVPAALDKKSTVAAGTLDWKLDGKVLLKPKPAGVDPESTLDGSLALSHAEFAIPGTRRRYHDVWLRVRHDASSVRLEGLSLRESDLTRKNRKLDVKGTLALRDFKPEKVDLRVTADQ